VTRATYTCDHCQAPVSLHARSCPSCGKVFDAVRCPRCGHQGSPGAFADGCPSCRYLAGRPPTPRPERRSVFGPAMAVLLVLLVLTVGLAWALRVF
jgi:predicted amidophosphoribosyltransferase